MSPHLTPNATETQLREGFISSECISQHESLRRSTFILTGDIILSLLSGDGSAEVRT